LSGGTRNRPPLSPKEAWLSNGRQVLHFRPSRWDRWSQQLEVTVGELLPDQPVPLLKKRLELSREQALKLWTEKKQQGWQTTAPQQSLMLDTNNDAAWRPGLVRGLEVMPLHGFGSEHVALVRWAPGSLAFAQPSAGAPEALLDRSPLWGRRDLPAGG